MAEDDFDPSKKYQTQHEIYFNDGREIELLHFVYNHADLENMRGNPAKVLAAVDEYARTKKYLMNVGEDKGRIVVEWIKKVKPQIMVELGGYVGYSAILFGATVKGEGGSRYWTLEKNPEFAAIITSLADLAGLSDVVRVVVGDSDASLRRLHATRALTHLDMLFLDHIKPAYIHDLKLCEELRLIAPGTVLVADNVVKPGNPPYLEYVRMTCEQKRTKATATSKEESQKDASDTPSTPAGNPNLVYESEFIRGWEPSGVPDALEITRCIAEE